MDDILTFKRMWSFIELAMKMKKKKSMKQDYFYNSSCSHFATKHKCTYLG